MTGESNSFGKQVKTEEGEKKKKRRGNERSGGRGKERRSLGEGEGDVWSAMCDV